MPATGRRSPPRFAWPRPVLLATFPAWLVLGALHEITAASQPDTRLALAGLRVLAQTALPPQHAGSRQPGLLPLLLGGLAILVGAGYLLARRRSSRRQLEKLNTESARAAGPPQTPARESPPAGLLEQRVRELTTQLDAANQELAAFSYSVSHDLRAPLRSIDGFSRALLEDAGHQLDDAAREHLHRIRSASQRAGVMIDGLIQLSRVSREEVRRERVDLGVLAGTVAADLRRAHPDRVLEFTIAPQLTAQADPRLLRIVLANLLDNACKFSRDQPVARIEVGTTLRDGQPAFFVRDNGAGFDLTYAQRLFGAFQRFHSPAEFSGHGLGLAAVQRIVHRHGGRVTAESQPGHGATFYFTLPEHPQPSP